jgi:hypothetical protein
MDPLDPYQEMMEALANPDKAFPNKVTALATASIAIDIRAIRGILEERSDGG